MRLEAGKFYGSTVKAISASGFRFTEKFYEPRLHIPRHSHELAHFCFVLEGIYDESIGPRTDERSPSAIIFYPPDVTHAETHRAAGRHFLIEIDSWRIDSLRQCAAMLQSTATMREGDDCWIAARLYREFSSPDEFSPLALEGLALEMLVRAARNGKTSERRAPRWLAQAKEFLRADFSAPPSLSALAATVGVHPVHLARVFRQFEGCTIGEYVRRLRVEYACRLMTTTDASLVEIALTAGFSDQTHFSRCFKRVTGMTPGQFRALVGRR
ncbi:MAG: AraC family transcriptional regulator [Acidobacteriota bacterium]